MRGQIGLPRSKPTITATTARELLLGWLARVVTPMCSVSAVSIVLRVRGIPQMSIFDAVVLVVRSARGFEKNPSVNAVGQGSLDSSDRF